jgi:hypothetical protein
VWPGAATVNYQNREQVSSFVRGYRGLVGMGIPPARWKDPSIRADERAAVKAVYEIINGKGSLRSVSPYETRHHG